MHDNPAADWQALTENYRAMLDGELEKLAEESATLTETAQQVLRAELQRRGLPEPGSKPRTWTETQGQTSFAGNADPDTWADEGGQPAPAEFTWKTPLRECGSEAEARALSEVLRRVGIESWVELPGRRGFALASPRVVVAADQLEQAIEATAKPIPQSLLDEFSAPAAEFEAPRCPACHAEDPVLESTDPTNQWLCEACGKQWAEPPLEES